MILRHGLLVGVQQSVYPVLVLLRVLLRGPLVVFVVSLVVRRRLHSARVCVGLVSRISLGDLVCAVEYDLVFFSALGVRRKLEQQLSVELLQRSSDVIADLHVARRRRRRRLQTVDDPTHAVHVGALYRTEGGPVELVQTGQPSLPVLLVDSQLEDDAADGFVVSDGLVSGDDLVFEDLVGPFVYQVRARERSIVVGGVPAEQVDEA